MGEQERSVGSEAGKEEERVDEYGDYKTGEEFVADGGRNIYMWA